VSVEKINAERIGRVEEKLDRLISDLPGMIQGAVQLGNTGRRGNGTDWKLIGVFVSLLALVGTGLFQSVDQNSKMMDRISQRLDAHMDLVYHPGVLTLVGGVQSELAQEAAAIREGNAREFGLLQVKVAEDVANLKAQILSSDARAKVMAEKQARFEAWKDRTQEAFGVQDAAQWERIKSTENLVGRNSSQ
jgi:hypothetical protein